MFIFNNGYGFLLTKSSNCLFLIPFFPPEISNTVFLLHSLELKLLQFAGLFWIIYSSRIVLLSNPRNNHYTLTVIWENTLLLLIRWLDSQSWVQIILPCSGVILWCCWLRIFMGIYEIIPVCCLNMTIQIHLVGVCISVLVLFLQSTPDV